jgi:prevent-host-death family protein
VAQFSLTDLKNRTGKVLEAALRGPVKLTRNGKRKFVLLTTEQYDRLVTAADTRAAFHADEAPTSVAEMMIKALEADIS